MADDHHPGHGPDPRPGDPSRLERLLDRTASVAVTAAARLARLLARAPDLRLGSPAAKRLRRASREPLPNLFDRHPEARTAPRRQLGLLTIPVARIVGTAVEGTDQRGGDFRPFPWLRGGNWESRWQRLRSAQQRLEILPPIDVYQAGDGYWVVDGHNRVALALYGNQDDIDAMVTHLHLPGETAPEPRAGSLAAGLAGSRDLRAAGEGRLSRGASVRAVGGVEGPDGSETAGS